RPLLFGDMKSASLVLFLTLSGSMIGAGLAQSTAAKRTSTQKSANVKKTASRTTPAKRSSSQKAAPGKSHVSSSRRTSASRRSAPRATAYRQASPTPERYKEIQAALAQKGYLKSEPTGVWNQESVEALRQFQTDRKLDPTGKITAASLIDLGLGPSNTQSIASGKPAGAATPAEPSRVEAAPGAEQ
ncbi:MAG TPA: peptidoglycan-binding domain-containing protein, partial [Bryobacteraceae bacterium]|nr:peptidoglycan-binding domain-containing protein [Bryobacteraceae bacterium]